MTETADHRAGFVGIIGNPNVGKSTLMEKLVGEKLSIITPKAQTTRHNILGIVNEDDRQIIFVDTPGLIQDPKYTLQKQMMAFVRQSLKDLELVLYMTTIFEAPEQVSLQLQNIKLKTLIIINKIDLGEQKKVAEQIRYFENRHPNSEVIPLSALHNLGTASLAGLIYKNLPVHPPYYPKDTLTTRPLQFFIAERIREQIFLNYRKEIPYCSEVVIDTFKEEAEIIRIIGRIIVERQTQKNIMVGKGGRMIKGMSIAARRDLEQFLGKKIFLHLEVKVIEKWRQKNSKLKEFGYIE